jgi:DNA repair protein SbcC/Rad50
MKLERLHIRLLPGLDEPFTVHFQPDALNFITGPNASGKSSLVRAVRAMLYPDLYPDFCHLHARWQIDGRALECERHGMAVSWLENGEPAPPPQLPGSESLGAYLVSSEDLVDFGSTEAHIANQVRTMLAGGYDLDAIIEQPPLAVPPRPQKRAREFAELQRRIQAKEDEYTRLNEELDTLARLQHELDETDDASSRLRACEDALALAEAIARRNALENTLIEEYPGGMDRLRGDELTRLDQIDAQLDERRKERQLAAAALDQAEKRLAETGATDPHQLEVLQSELADRRDSLAALETEIEQHAAGLEQARQDRATAAQRLGGNEPGPQHELAQEELEQFERLVDRVMGLREKVRTLTGELARNHVTTAASPHSDEKLRRARQALVDWLEYCRLTPLEGWLWGGLGLVALIATWRVLGPQDVDVVPELILLILLAVGVPLGLLGRFADRWRQLARSRENYAATGVEAPLGWTESEVESRLERLERELEAATQHGVRQARASEVRERLNNERSALDKAREKLAEHASTLGLSAEGRMETGFLLWCRNLRDWQNAGREMAHRQHAMSQARERHRSMASEVAELLERHGLKQDQSLSSRDLASLVHQLAPRIRAHTELHNEIRGQRRRIEELDADLERLAGQQAEIFRQAGLKDDDRETLTRRIEQFEEWRTLEQQRRERSLEVNRLEHRLAAMPELLNQAREQQRDALEQLRDELHEQAARRDDLNRRIAAIHTRHEDLLERRELEALTGELESQRQALEEELEAQLLAHAGQVLIDDVRTAHRADNEPAALTRATRWFERFTRHRYRLRFTGEHFAAFDTRAEQARSITQLSTATRMQLLLALRLAWIEQAERNREPLPVFMDEVLTTSDPDRYRLIVESVQDIVAGGRQMFYLTAQGDEATAWAAWAGDGPAPNVIDMAEVRRGQVQPLELRMPDGGRQRLEVPDPEGMRAEDWAESIGIGPINPWAGSGMVSVFHLLHDNLDLAARLIRGELERIGELGAYLEARLDDKLLSEHERSLLRQRARAAALVLDDWRLRHHRPVDGATLIACGLVSDTFLPRVIDLARSLDGHPQRLIDALRDGQVPRFRADVIDQLEQWLADNRYLASGADTPAITAAELASRTGMDVEAAATIRDQIIGAIRDPLASHSTEGTVED